MKAKAQNKRPGPRRGFTLIELMVVIAILAMLVAIVIPAFDRVRTQMKRATTLATFNTISVGLSAYKTELATLPESWFPNFDNGNWYGSQTLVEAMTGYAPVNIDGADGQGFRILQREQPHGPYVPVEKMKTKLVAASSGSARLAFVDSFDQPILYYKYDSTKSTDNYTKAHNPAGNVPLPAVSGPADINKYAWNNNQYYRTDFILCTPGPDGKFDDQWTPGSDDCTNFGAGG